MSDLQHRKRIAVLSIIFMGAALVALIFGLKSIEDEIAKIDLLEKGVTVTADVTDKGEALTSCRSNLFGNKAQFEYTYNGKDYNSEIALSYITAKALKKEITDDGKLEILVDPDDPERVSEKVVLEKLQKQKILIWIFNYGMIVLLSFQIFRTIMALIIIKKLENEGYDY